MVTREQIEARLSEYYEPADVLIWMASRHPQLDGETAEDLIAIGQGARVAAVIDRLDGDAYI